MNLLENIRIALRALAANKLRSSLTMLGIIIGVAAVVALMAVGAGATSEITSSIEGLGTNMITVTSGRAFSFIGHGGGSSDSQADWIHFIILITRLFLTMSVVQPK